MGGRREGVVGLAGLGTMEPQHRNGCFPPCMHSFAFKERGGDGKTAFARIHSLECSPVGMSMKRAHADSAETHTSKGSSLSGASVFRPVWLLFSLHVGCLRSNYGFSSPTGGRPGRQPFIHQHETGH